MAQPCPTYFMHVPKAGGSTLTSFLEGLFSPAERIRLNEETLARLAPEDLGRFRFYSSQHLGRSMLELIGRDDLKCITMLRDPVERSVSQILYMQRSLRTTPEKWAPEYLEKNLRYVDADLEECIERNAFFTFHAQLKVLGDRVDYRPLFKSAAGPPSTLLGRQSRLPRSVKPNDRDQWLENAKAWLDEMAVVGVVERYDESVELICHALGVTRPARLKRHNANPARAESAGGSPYRAHLSARALELLEKNLVHDRLLYDHAVKLFHEQWNRHLAQATA